jgi:acyl-CoA reductase-like NAD-dependent aldehyde dehydrogenase
MTDATDWAALSVQERVSRVCPLRHALAEQTQNFIDAIELPWRRDAGETVAAEIFPLAEACGFLEREAPRLLAPRIPGWLSRPLWLWGTSASVCREPWGKVLIIGPGNYPLMLPGIQAVQALVAGNTVLFKPAPKCGRIARVFAEALYASGVPQSALKVLDDTAQAARDVIGLIDKVVLTGAAHTGSAVLSDLSNRTTPAIMELSGCDAVYIMDGADLDRAARSVAFGLTFNSSSTCMAPRRIFVHRNHADDFAKRLIALLASAPVTPIIPAIAARLNDLGRDALAAGATLLSGRLPVEQPSSPILFDNVEPSMGLAREDVMAPVTSILRVDSDQAALTAAKECGYRLSASIFGPEAAARKMAAQVNAGCITVNDMIAPSADPRLPFGGRGRSGFGVTRGAEGLLEMTQIKTIVVRTGGMMPYLSGSSAQTEALLRGFLGLSHSSTFAHKLRAGAKLIFGGKGKPTQ